jgi:hypothetical protein
MLLLVKHDRPSAPITDYQGHGAVDNVVIGTDYQWHGTW